MRGFFLTALVLVGLDVALKAPAARTAAALATPAAWLAKWMSATTPLISAPVPSSSSSSSSGGGGGLLQQLDAGNPSAQKPNQLGEGTTGKCPPGFPAGTKCLAM